MSRKIKKQNHIQVNQKVASLHLVQGYYTKESPYFQESSKKVSIKKVVNIIFLHHHTNPCHQDHSLCPENLS